MSRDTLPPIWIHRRTPSQSKSFAYLLSDPKMGRVGVKPANHLSFYIFIFIFSKTVIDSKVPFYVDKQHFLSN